MAGGRRFERSGLQARARLRDESFRGDGFRRSQGIPVSLFRRKDAVRRLHASLLRDGLRPWLDAVDISPGVEWKIEIERAVRASDVVLVCLSRSSVSKTGFVQKEIAFALDAADERPEGTVYIVPARLETCDAPQRLSKWQWVYLFEQDGYPRLLRALTAQRQHRS